jgi:hypothetical protein
LEQQQESTDNFVPVCEQLFILNENTKQTAMIFCAMNGKFKF